MFRRLFRIGFGGCGCALEQEFRDHAVELTRKLLVTYYLKDLEKWESVLDNELFKMDYLVDLRHILIEEKGKQPEFRDTTFEETIDEVSGRLDEWKSLLTKVEKVARSYDVTFIDKVRGTITNMRDEAESTKRRGSVLLESLPVDSFTKTEAEKYTRFYTYNQDITETRELIIDQFGHAVIESQGFNHQPELQMLPFSIKEVRDEVFKNIREHITRHNLSSLTSEGYFFYVGLGGGTGTGVISPLAEKFGKGSYGYFALAVLGAEEDDNRMKTQQPWFRRCFNMLIALNDLIVTAELDGLILVDNARLIQAVDEDEEQGKRENPKTQGKQLVEVEEQPQESSEQKQTAEMEQPDETPSDGLKGTPLMTKVDEKLIKALYPAFGITTVENEDYDLDWSQLKGPIGLHTLENKPPIIVPCYASGPCSSAGDNLEVLIDAALDKGMLAPCEYQKDNKLIPKKVFVYVRCIKDEDKLREKLAEKFAYLFSIDAKFENNLKNNTITGELEGIFKTKFSIPQEVTPEVTDKNDKWVITAGKKVYIAKKEDGNLNIYASDEIAILKEYLFCLDDVVEGKDYKELERFLKNFYDPNFNLKDYTKKEEIDEEKLIFCKNGSDKCVTVQIGGHLFDWIDREIKDYKGLKEYLEKKKIPWGDPHFSKDGKKIIIGKGETKAEITLDEKNKKATLSWDKEGKEKKQDLDVKRVKKREKRRIYEPNEVKITIEGTQIEEALFEVKKRGKKRHLYLKGCDSSINWVKKNLEKKIVVFESQEIGSFWHEREKKNEVLILLVNPDVKNVLKERLKEAKKFVDLLVTFSKLLEASTEDKSRTAGKIVGDKIDTIVFEKEKDVEDLKRKLEENLEDIPDTGIIDDIKREELIKASGPIKGPIEVEKLIKKKKLKEAMNFLLPEELYEKDKDIYEYMKGVLERLNREAEFLDGYLDGTRKWPIFREKGNIFNIISTSDKRDEVILSAIEALDENTQNRFNKLVGEGVYNTYFETFKRQYFKYNARYLYSGVGEPILSDAAEKELPVALEKKLDNEKVRIEGEKLKDLVDTYTSEMSGHAGTTDGTELSYPAMLAVAGLYAEWEQVGSWNYDNKNGFVLAKEYKDKIIELFKKNGAHTSGDFEDYVFSKESTKTKIPDKCNLLIIDADEEDATLVIREADKDLLTPLTKEEVPREGIPQKLVDKFIKELGIEDVKNDYYEVTDGKLQPKDEAKKQKKLYRCYYIRVNNGNYSIDGDKILNEQLKVKKEGDGKTLKIYKKRGE